MKKHKLDVYRNQYWKAATASKEILKNRISFAEEFSIDGPADVKGVDFEKIPRRIFDHIETYELNGGTDYLCLISPYTRKNTKKSVEALEDEALEFGFHPVSDMYSKGAQSFIRIFKSFEEMESFLQGK